MGVMNNYTELQPNNREVISISAFCFFYFYFVALALFILALIESIYTFPYLLAELSMSNDFDLRMIDRYSRSQKIRLL